MLEAFTLMITNNPFVVLSAFISPLIMQGYVVLMAILVAIGTIADMVHKQSAKYFFSNTQRMQNSAKRQVSACEKTSITIKTITNEVLTSSEFNNTKRRMSHLLTMYGFIIFVVTSIVLIFKYPNEDGSTLITSLWHISAAMLSFGGLWFWLFIRVDVVAEGTKWHSFKGRGDIFIVGLISMAVFGLLWSLAQQIGFADGLFCILFILCTTMLFGTVYWSKFAHMFFKPAAAYQKRLTITDGTRENLPDDYDLSDPAVQARFPDIPKYMGMHPPYMGLGISREPPNHY